MSDRRNAVRDQLSRDVQLYLRAPYVRMLIPDAEEGGFSAEVLELPGCVSQGETAEEAYENLQDAMSGWIAAALAYKKPIPEPVGEKEYSGQFALRMSTELHRAAALRAMHDGVSLNQWIARAIAERVAGEDLGDRIASKIVEGVSVEAIGGLQERPVQTVGPDLQGSSKRHVQQIREESPQPESCDASSPPLAEEGETENSRDA